MRLDHYQLCSGEEERGGGEGLCGMFATAEINRLGLDHKQRFEDAFGIPSFSCQEINPHAGSFTDPVAGLLKMRVQVSGRHSGGVTPVPIPNTAVKPSSADGTVTVGVTGE